MVLSSQEGAGLRCGPELSDLRSVLSTTARSLSSLGDDHRTVY